jgi:uncharacterized membrane protein YidH (DUF202 family)
VYGVGEEPDARFSFANERTMLAWVRTALGLLAAAVVLDAVPLSMAEPVRRGLAALLVVLACRDRGRWVGALGAGGAGVAHRGAAAGPDVGGGRGRRAGRGGGDGAGRGSGVVTGCRPPGPLPRAGLQNERTALAWNRTGLALLGVAAVVVRLRLERPGVLAMITVAVCTLLCLGVLIASIRRYRAAHTHPAGRSGIDARLPTAVVALIVVLAVIELVAILS